MTSAAQTTAAAVAVAEKNSRSGSEKKKKERNACAAAGAMNFLCFFCIEPKSRRVIRDNLYIFLSLFWSFLPYCGYIVLNVARSILE